MRNSKYRQLRLPARQPAFMLHDLLSQFISEFTIASLRSVGSRPMARQNRITCITGNAKINSITLKNIFLLLLLLFIFFGVNTKINVTYPTFLHIRRKFFCSNALIFPLLVIFKTFDRLQSEHIPVEFVLTPAIGFPFNYN